MLRNFNNFLLFNINVLKIIDINALPIILKFHLNLYMKKSLKT